MRFDIFSWKINFFQLENLEGLLNYRVPNDSWPVAGTSSVWVRERPYESLNDFGGGRA